MTAPPRAPGELAQIDPAWFVLAKMRINLSAANGIRLSKDELATLAASPIGPLMDAARAYGAGTAGEVMPDPRLMRGAELGLRSATGDGGEAMRAAAAACAAGWRTPALKHAGLNEVEQDIARRTAAGIEAAILDLPLAQPDRLHETATGGETDA